jgi:diaminopimelate epimerase
MSTLANHAFVKMNGLGNEIVVVDLRAQLGAVAPGAAAPSAQAPSAITAAEAPPPSRAARLMIS